MCYISFLVTILSIELNHSIVLNEVVDMSGLVEYHLLTERYRRTPDAIGDYHYLSGEHLL